MTIIDYFAKTAIINLAERADRRAETREEFKRAGWPIENTKADFFPAIRPMEAAGFPSVGVRGCFLSHMLAIKQAKKEHLANILIMEDDIAFIADINSIAAEALQELEGKKWGFLYLGHEHHSDLPSETRLEKISEPLLLAHFYAVNSTIFDRFLTFLEELLQRTPGDPAGGPMHYDGAISTFRMQNPDINTFIVLPSLGYQRSSRTDLHPLSLWDRWRVLKPLTAGLRKLKNRIKRSAG